MSLQRVFLASLRLLLLLLCSACTLVCSEVVSRASHPILKTTAHSCGYDQIILVQVCLLCDASTCGIYRIAYRSDPVAVRTDIPTSVRSFIVRSGRRLAYVYYTNNSLIQYNMDNWLAAPLDTGFSFNRNGASPTGNYACGSTCVPSSTCDRTYSAPPVLTVGDDGNAYGVVFSCQFLLVLVRYQVPPAGSTSGGGTSYPTISMTNSSFGSVQAFAPYLDSSNTQRLYAVLSGGTCPLLYKLINPGAGSSSTIMCRTTTTCPVGTGTVSGLASTYDALHDRIITVFGNCNAVVSVQSGDKITVLAGTGAAGYTDGFAPSEAVVQAPQAPSIAGRHIYFFSKAEDTTFLIGRVYGATSTQSQTLSHTISLSATPDESSSESITHSKSLTKSQTTSMTVSGATVSASPSPLLTDTPSISHSPSQVLSSSNSVTESSDATLSGTPSESPTGASLSSDPSPTVRSLSVSRSASPPTTSPSWTTTPSASSMRSLTDSVTPSSSASLTRISWSPSPSALVTSSYTQSPSSDSTLSGSPTRGTLSPSPPTQSPSSTSTASSQLTMSETHSASEVQSASPQTRSPTTTITESPTLTNSYTRSWSAATSTRTPSATPSLSRSLSPSGGSPSHSAATASSPGHSRSLSSSRSRSLTRSPSRSTLMTTARGRGAHTFSLSTSPTDSPSRGTLSMSTRSVPTSTIHRTSNTKHPPTATVERVSTTATFFIDDRTDKQPFYIAVGVAGGMIGAAVVGGIIFGVVKSMQGAATTAAAGSTAAGTSSAPSVPVIGVARAVPTNIPLVGAHYAAPVVRQEGSTRRVRLPPTTSSVKQVEVSMAQDTADESPWWASASAPPPPSSKIASYGIEEIDVEMDDEPPFFFEDSAAVDVGQDEAVAFMEEGGGVAAHEPLWFEMTDENGGASSAFASHSDEILEMSPV